VRAFRLLFFGQSSSVLGDAVSGIALTFAVLELGGGATGLGVVLAAGTVPFLVFLLVAGIGEFASIMFMLSRSSVRRLRVV
jgi:hypothetical protein